MKNIVIEKAVNGWVVSPKLSTDICVAATSVCHVYADIESLAKALPNLLDDDRVKAGPEKPLHEILKADCETAGMTFRKPNQESK